MSEEENVAISLKVLAEILGQTVDLKEPPKDAWPAVDSEPTSASGEHANEEETLRDEPTDIWGDGRLGSSRRGSSNSQTWHEAPAPQMHKKEEPSPSKAMKLSQVLDYSTFQVGEPVAEEVCFCSWNLVLGYPERYIGKANKPRVRPFFDKILEGRVWDFFYIHDVSAPQDKPQLLVPTVQLEEFLYFINEQLDISLKIPDGVNQDRFYIKFGQGQTPRPRYLQRCRDKKTLNVETWPQMDPDDMVSFKAARNRDRALWTTAFSLVQTKLPSKKQETKWKSLQKRKHREAMLNATHHLLGLDKQGGENVVFVCIDVEAIEVSPKPISEIGIAILDTGEIMDVPHASDGSSWWPMIKSFHLRVKEYAGLVNRLYVQGCPDHFDFGKSTFPAEADILEAIMEILNPYIEAERDLVFVGHDFKHDEQYLASLGLRVASLMRQRSTIDTQTMHQAWSGRDNGCGLRGVLGDLELDSKHLHNAGNDAVYTLRAMIGLAIRPPRRADAAAAESTEEPNAED
ncbi:hypothetical protein B0I35DRAFT_473261 [Stachybotrys elegans]|uniref:Gfd2/YDR514C-like C-terminal domain-containing protein n=1 Tax=Stachybotrys elegans TaxID=80388 RepID=A0A8K0WWE2_9HYPO|nr:hypothetical protein B0I35DRAFT_473261 [Stachybotrys elegans]